MNFLEKIRNANSKKTMENSVIFLILCIIVIIVINSLFDSNDKAEEIANLNAMPNVQNDISNDTDFEKKLENILSLIEGAGKVDVMISYLNGIEQIPMYDEKVNTTITNETDKEGGKRTTEQVSNEHNIIFDEKNNSKVAVIKQTIMPEVVGVIVVSDGANDLKVKENIIKAVEATVNVPSHRIQVFASARW